jgi:hypothetical protein
MSQTRKPLTDEQIAGFLRDVPGGGRYGITIGELTMDDIRSALRELQQRRALVPAYWSPEWVEGALTEHVRSLGCKCKSPLLGYTPNAGPRCRLCGVDAALVPAPDLAEVQRAWFYAGWAGGLQAVDKFGEEHDTAPEAFERLKANEPPVACETGEGETR